MTRDQFIKAYCDRSRVTWEELSRYRVALPCACGEGCCDGWAMVPNDPDSVRTHTDLYAPIGDQEKT